MGAGAQLPYDDGHVQFPDARHRIRGPRRPPRRRGHRGRHAALPRRPRRGEGPRRIHPLPGCRRASGRSSDDRTKRARRRTRGSPRSCCRDVVPSAIRAVAKHGFTERQAGFLVTVMLHSGVCVGRQYCAYARHRPRPEGPRLLLLPGGQEAGHAVHRGASTSAHLPRPRQAALRRDRRAEQPQPQARHAGPRRRAADGARRRARRAPASVARQPSARRSSTSARRRRSGRTSCRI